MRGGWPSATVALSALVALACWGCGGHAPSSTAGLPSSSAAGAGRAASSTPSAPGAHRPRPSPTGLAALRRHLAAQMRRAGPASGAYVYDVSAGRAIYALRADVARPPASVEKLYTSAAVLTRLGADASLSTTVLGRGSLTSAGVWRGDLYLRGGGDPTLGSAAFDAVYDEGRGSTVTSLAAQLVERAGIRRVTGRVLGDESLFDSLRGGPVSGYGADVLDLGGQLGALTYNHGSIGSFPRGVGGRAPPSPALGPGAYAALQLVHSLDARGVRTHAARDTAPTPTGATVLARVSSPSVPELLGLMNRPSDDFFAEMLVKQLGARFGGSGSLMAGTRVIADVLAAQGVHARVLDGSGLSRQNSTTPHEVVKLLRSIAATPEGQVLRGSLPVAGVSGTLAARMRRTVAAGRCQAKTGSLIDISNLAGYCRSRGGHLVAFAFFMAGPPTVQAHTLQDNMAITIARDDPALP